MLPLVLVGIEDPHRQLAAAGRGIDTGENLNLHDDELLVSVQDIR